MKILVIAGNYPSRSQPNNGAFVYNLMQEIGKQHQVIVISPSKIDKLFKRHTKTYGLEICEVKRPTYLSLGRRIGTLDSEKIGVYFYKKAVNRVLKQLNTKPDVIYCHFLKNAIPVLNYSKDNNIPLIVASGESTYNSWSRQPDFLKEELKKQVDHIICVAMKNKDKLKKLGFDTSKMTVIPNAVNYNLFKPLDKIRCKEKLGIENNKFVVGFIGHFIHRKGPNRIIKAIKKLNDQNINLICIGGKGDLEENSFTKVLSPVPNFQLPEIYNAFDVFVLPTLHEGHCNVIEEAKACGVPIVSSKGTSVEEQIDKETGVLIDPLNIDDIANAILKLKEESDLKEEMTANLVKRRGENSIQNRARKINSILYSVYKKNIL